MNLLRHCVVLFALLWSLPVPAGAQSSPPVQTGVTYRYDALGRLIEARYPNGRVITYRYDESGNRTLVIVGA